MEAEFQSGSEGWALWAHQMLAETNQDSIFAKYRLGKVNLNAPFKLFEINCSTSGDEDLSGDIQTDKKVRGPYRRYTLEQKMDAVARIERGEDVKFVAKQFGIPRRNLLRWKRNGCERKEGGGRPTNQELEQAIFGKIKNGELTDENQIRKFAKEFSQVDTFKASKGWFVKFCSRFNLHLPAPHLTQKEVSS